MTKDYRYAALLMMPWSLVIMFLVGAKGCSETDCAKLRAAADAACATPGQACDAARQALAIGCPPPPMPTPEPPPPPPPLCSDGLPAGPDGCPKTCDDLACPAGCDQPDPHKDAVCRPEPPPTPPPTPPPSPAGCSIDGEPGPMLPDHKPTLGATVNQTMSELTGCDPGSRCVLVEGRQAWQARVIAKLRLRGLCAGQHEPVTDEIAVATSVIAPREGGHVYAGPDAGPGTVVWFPGAARPAWSAPDGGPPEPPPPVESLCPAPLPDKDPAHLRIGIAVRGNGWRDATLSTMGTLAYCEAIGMSPMADGTPRAGCPMRSECPGFQCEMRGACEAYVGLPVWQTQPADLPTELRDGNPWVARCDGCEQMRACSGGVCSEWK